MILYTTMPAELVLGKALTGETNQISGTRNRNRPSGTIATTSEWVQTCETPQGECVSRIVSTNLKSYLDPSLQPGTLFGSPHPSA